MYIVQVNVISVSTVSEQPRGIIFYEKYYSIYRRKTYAKQPLSSIVKIAISLETVLLRAKKTFSIVKVG